MEHHTLKNHSRSVHYLVYGAILIVILVLQFYHTALFELLRYERESVAKGEFWRLITAHFVHVSWGHCCLNIVGYMLTLILIGKYLSTAFFMLSIVISMFSIDIGLFIFHADIQWYAGLSGVLHGLLLAGLILAYQVKHYHWLKWLMLLLLVKLIWEMFAGALPGSTRISEGRVIVEAHLYGAIGGLMSSLFAYIWARQRG